MSTNDLPLFKCFRCGKQIPHVEGWEVTLQPLNHKGAPAHFLLCPDCRVIWQIAMGKWLTTGHGREAKESIENGGKEETGSAEMVSSADNHDR